MQSGPPNRKEDNKMYRYELPCTIVQDDSIMVAAGAMYPLPEPDKWGRTEMARQNLLPSILRWTVSSTPS